VSAAEFERVWHWIAAALARDETHSKADIWNMIESGAAQLHALPHSGCVTIIETHPNGVRCLRWWLAGGDLTELLNYEPLIAEWARSLGCTKATLTGREGWAKPLAPLGFKKSSVTLCKDL
jgi:hypothetical protein